MISVMLPTRGRPALCLESAMSMLDLAECPDDVEIVLRRDWNDATRYDAIPQSVEIVGPSLGYAGLSEYYDACAATSRGEWLVVWNDDSTMLTKHWDAELRRLDPRTSWIMLAHEHFPTISRRWYEVTGRISASAHVDTFVIHVADILVADGVLHPPDKRKRWDILHKCDVLDDEGSERRRREILGPQGTSAKFFSPEIRSAIELDAKKIASAITIHT
jgi:hypothetical protein